MRVSLHIEGVVQGVGFRPFVYQQATSLGLSGWIKNGRSGVEIELSGPEETIERFCWILQNQLPLPGRITSLSQRIIDDIFDGNETFRILASREDESPKPILPPDLATCTDCLNDVLAPDGRRSGYPLTCCSRCGPRYSIVEELPYDRSRTTMKSFAPCEDCAREYSDPFDRRFFAEPIACPRCGPKISLLSNTGQWLASGTNALIRAADALRENAIVAMRGLGGFQILCNATNGHVVAELRRRKHRDDKPFAVLFKDMAMLDEHATVSPNEKAALLGPEAPIVLTHRKDSSTLAPDVAPNCPLVGGMLPTTAMHRMLADTVDLPLVCTSGNLSGEPLCVDTDAALTRLGAIADYFLVHDRPITRPIDDSVMQEGPFGMAMMRRARGFAPLPIGRIADERCVLGLGAYLKSTVALSVRGEIVLSQHLGDMDDPESVDLLERTVRDLLRFFDVRPQIIACDLHPDFASTRLAQRLTAEFGARLVRVQHHHAHVAAVLAEHDVQGDVFALVWDGFGFGSDELAWGGEAFLGNMERLQRVGFLKPFRLPGGDVAAREPRRSALGLLSAAELRCAAMELSNVLWNESAVRTVLQTVKSGFNSPWTTSIGRLFDAIASLIGIRQVCTYEGQAAMELQWCAETNSTQHPAPYPFPISDTQPWIADPGLLVRALLEDRSRGAAQSEMAARFISSLVDMAVRLCERAGKSNIVLTGGCFQNALLTTDLVRRLQTIGMNPLLPIRAPANDGGISLGQVAVASRVSMHQEGV